MKIKLLLLALTLLGILAYDSASALGGQEPLSLLLPANPLQGSRLFTEKGCLRCHSVYGVGGVTGPDLGQGILKRPLLDIAGAMWNHSPRMAHVFQEQRATRPQFKPEEMASLLAFLYYLGSLDPPGDAVNGARLFREKQCQTCHSLGGKGGRHGPPLDPYSKYTSPIYLTAALWKKGRAMASAMEALKVPRPTFEENNIPDLLAYIRSAGGGIQRVYVQPGNPKNGERLFSEKRCKECHSVGDGDHGGRIGPNLRGKVKGSLMRIAGSMWNHGPKMWATMAQRGIGVPSLSTEQMSDIISYLYFLQFIDSPGNAVRGRTVYLEKRCGACHTLPGVGGTLGPDLSKVDKLGTPLEVVTEMWNHASTMEQKMLEESVEWPVFKGGEMADLIAYLLSLRSGPGQPASPRKSVAKGS